MKFTSFELRAVIEQFNNVYLFYSGDYSVILTQNPSNLFRAISSAYLNPQMIIYGCIPSSTNGLASFNNSAAKRVTDVVPSPTSSS